MSIWFGMSLCFMLFKLVIFGRMVLCLLDFVRFGDVSGIRMR